MEDRQKKDTKIQDLESKLNIAEEKKLNALNELKNKATNKINLLNNEVIKLKEDIERQSVISDLSSKNKVIEAVNSLEKEKTSLINSIEKMKDIKCPSCGKTFRIDPSSFQEILLQIKDEEFNKQIEELSLIHI